MKSWLNILLTFLSYRKISQPSPRADESLSVVLYQPKLADINKLSSSVKKESSVKIVELEDYDEEAMELWRHNFLVNKNDHRSAVESLCHVWKGSKS